MKNDSSSSFVNGGSNNLSLLSLLMAEDNETFTNSRTQTLLFPSYYEMINPVPVEPNMTHFLSSFPPKPEPIMFGNYEEINKFSLSSQLPELLSLENSQNQDSYSLESILEDYYRHPKKARKRPFQAKTLSQKAYCLGKLLPGAHRRRRTTAEMLDDAYKYIKFLQAQVSALRSMPVDGGGCGEGGGGSTGLGRLSRQQVLEVVVNSTVAQTVMAEKGWCVVAAEQVALMKKIEARNRLIHHLLANIPL